MISRHVRVFEEGVSDYPHAHIQYPFGLVRNPCSVMLWRKFKCFQARSPFYFSDNVYSLYPNQRTNAIVCFALVVWTVNPVEAIGVKLFFITCAISLRRKLPKTVSYRMTDRPYDGTRLKRPWERDTVSIVRTAISIASKKAKDTWNNISTLFTSVQLQLLKVVILRSIQPIYRENYTRRR